MHCHDFDTARLLRLVLALGLLGAPFGPAWAVVKCVAADGRITFQDVGCDVHSTSQPLVKRFGQLSTEDAAPRTSRSRPTDTTGQRTAAALAPHGNGMAGATPAWR